MSLTLRLGKSGRFSKVSSRRIIATVQAAGENKLFCEAKLLEDCHKEVVKIPEISLTFFNDSIQMLLDRTGFGQTEYV